VATILLVPAQTWAQTVVGTINAPPETYWNYMELYQTGGKLFIADNTNAQILIYDANSLDYVDVISLAPYLPALPQCMAVHEGTGTLYVAVSLGYATSDTTIVIIDADTYAIADNLTDIGMDLSLTIDESRARLYTLGRDDWLDETLTAININTNSIVGSLNIDDLMGGGLLSFDMKRHLNPVTGELFFSNIHYDKFVVVDGPNLTGELISATGSRGWGGTWNPQENKLYITRAAWNGYFIYDRDTATSTIANSYNDGTSLFYSQATNRVYSGAEVNGDTTVIEGDTDAWQDVEVGGGLAEVGFVNQRHHAYFASPKLVCVLDEDSLTVVDSIPNCRPDCYGGVSTQIIVNQNKGRVFIRSIWSQPVEGSCVFVIDDLEPVKNDFNGDGQGDILWRNYADGRNAVWYMGYSNGGMTGLSLKNFGMMDMIQGLGQTKIYQDPMEAGGLPSKGEAKVYTSPVDAADLAYEPEEFKFDLSDGKEIQVLTEPGDVEDVEVRIQGLAIIGSAYFNTVADTNWHIAGTGDFNGDGKVDILWRSYADGRNAVWYMDGMSITGSAYFNTVADTNWKIENH